MRSGPLLSTINYGPQFRGRHTVEHKLNSLSLSPRACICCLAVSVGYLTNDTFAERLERAIRASDRAKLIEGHATRDE